LCGAAKGIDHSRVDLRSGEGVAGGNVREPDEGVHEGELSRVVELEPGNAFSR
jgi:hypothetical protein